MDPRVTQILVCPICKGPLFWDAEKKELYCRTDMKAFPAADDIPCMVPAEARDLSEKEVDDKDARRKA